MRLISHQMFIFIYSALEKLPHLLPPKSSVSPLMVRLRTKVTVVLGKIRLYKHDEVNMEIYLLASPN